MRYPALLNMLAITGRSTYQRSDQVARTDDDHVGVLSQLVQSRQHSVDCADGVKRLFPTQGAVSPGGQCLDLVDEHTDERVFLLFQHRLNVVKHFTYQLTTLPKEFASQRVGVDFDELALRIVLSQAYCEFLSQTTTVLLAMSMLHVGLPETRFAGPGRTPEQNQPVPVDGPFVELACGEGN